MKRTSVRSKLKTPNDRHGDDLMTDDNYRKNISEIIINKRCETAEQSEIVDYVISVLLINELSSSDLRSRLK